MVPIHDSDVAENRWREGEWRQFELWERIEQRFHRRRLGIILAVVAVFLAILAVPVIQDRVPKWRATHAMRALAVKVNEMKIDAAALGVPLRIVLEASAEGPAYRLDRVERCDPVDPGSVTHWGGGPLFASAKAGANYVVLDPKAAPELGLERIVSSFCYDPFRSTEGVVGDSSAGGGPAPASAPTAMAILTVKDLADARLDRIAFLNFSGLFAEIDFD